MNAELEAGSIYPIEGSFDAVRTRRRVTALILSFSASRSWFGWAAGKTPAGVAVTLIVALC